LEAARFSNTSVKEYQTIRHDTPEGGNLHGQNCFLPLPFQVTVRNHNLKSIAAKERTVVTSPLNKVQTNHSRTTHNVAMQWLLLPYSGSIYFRFLVRDENNNNSIQFNSVFINVLNSTANGQLQSQHGYKQQQCQNTGQYKQKKKQENIKESKSAQAN
jgi:hypothetical protein